MLDLVLGSKMCYNQDNNKLSRWCRVFLVNDEKELTKILGSDLMENSASKKLVEEINEMSSDFEYVELYTKLSRKELEYNTYIEEAKEEGLNLGIKEGIVQGKKQEKINIANIMLKEKMDISTISKITGLSISEITKL